MSSFRLANLPNAAPAVLYFFVVLTVVALTFSIAVSSITMAAAIVIAIVYIAVTRGKAIDRTPLDVFFIAYCLAELIATIFSINPVASLFNMKRLLLISIVYVTLMSVTNEKRISWALGLLLGTTALLSLFEMLFITQGGEFLRLGVFQHYMTAGGIKMIVVLLLLPFVIEKQMPIRWRVATTSALLLTFAALLFTQTRSSWLGFLAGAIVLGIVKSRKLLIGLGIAVILFALSAPLEFRIRAASIFDPDLRSNRARIQMIETGWKMFLDYPIFGTGDIDLRQLYLTYTKPIDPAEGGHLHNNIAMVLVTLGGIGFLAIMALFVKIFQVELSAYAKTRDDWLLGSATLGSLCAYIGFHVNGLFEWNFGDHEIAVLLWFTVGLALSSQKLSSKKALMKA